MTKESKPPKIARKLIEAGQTLHFAFGPDGGRRFWLEPSNKNVTEEAARRAIAWPGIKPLGDCLLPDLTPQSWGYAP